MNKLEENWELYKLGIPWKDTEALEGDEREFLLKQAGEIRDKLEEQQKAQEEAMKQQEAMRQAALAQQQAASQQQPMGGMQGAMQQQPAQITTENPFTAEKDARIAELESQLAEAQKTE